MWSWRYDGLQSERLGRNSKHIYLGDTRVLTKVARADGFETNEDSIKQYYYHSDHLGSAQLITNADGDEYERIEYTPYGELWVEKASAASNIDIPYRFTGKERDEETGLYYFGARYLDPKYSRWLSTDPALSDYIPGAPVNDEAKKRNKNLPGMGGVFNTVNLHLYHYAGNNPVKYIDPDGRETITILFANKSMISELKRMQNQVLNDPKLMQGAGGPYNRTDAKITKNTTWCNQATYQTTRVSDSTLAKAMYNGGDSNGDHTNAREVSANLKSAANGSNSQIAEVTPKIAQALANLGITVVGTKDTTGIGHVATVAPGYDFNETDGPMMANVGGSDRQGYTRAKSAFRGSNYENGNVHFYINKGSLQKLDALIMED
ncbi:MAG TPA: RHS repeat-associated core domain-containing protein, partial [Lachnospiraceae bacterium]|nr:RHS repeat-associated core domain-containing protein [Lachnospiraceae bacterium]